MQVFFFPFVFEVFLKMITVLESLHLSLLPSQRLDSQRLNEYLDGTGTV